MGITKNKSVNKNFSFFSLLSAIVYTSSFQLIHQSFTFEYTQEPPVLMLLLNVHG